MDPQSWAKIYNSLKRHQSRSDEYRGLEHEWDDEPQPEYLCPFCTEEFDMVGFCCHIDEEHPVQSANGVCPVCAKKVGSNLVPHLTVQHHNLLKVQPRRIFRRGGSNFSFVNLRNELQEGKLDSFLNRASFLVAPSHDKPDPLLKSFIFNPPALDESRSVQTPSSNEVFSIAENTVKDHSDRVVVCQSEEERKERAQRCEFVWGLVLSTLLDN